MRVLATVFATKPHLFNLVPVLWALRAAGHEVCVASHPDLMETVTRVGLTGVPVGNELNMMQSLRDKESDGGGGAKASWESLTSGMTETRPERLSWNYVLGAFTMGCSADYDYVTDRQLLDDLVEFARNWQPDLVIWDALTFAGAVAAKACGAAHARMLFGIDYISRMYDHFQAHLADLPEAQRDDPVSDWLAGRMARVGCDFSPDLSRELMTGQVTIDPTPGWMQLPITVPRLPVRQVPFNGGSTIPDWVLEQPTRPRVCLSLGLSGQLLGGDFVSVPELLGSLAELPVELIATLNTDQLADVGDLPDNVRAVDFVPLNELAPTCTAIIHHGGFGTLVNVMNHGVPSLTIPAPWWDEQDLGRHLHERGAGIHLEPAATTAAVLTAAVRDLLADPAFARNATAVQREIHTTPTPSQLTTSLERLATT